MPFEFTPAVRRALHAAHAWAEACHAFDPEPLHLLLSLLDEEEGAPVEMLRAHAVDVDQLRAHLSGGHATPPRSEPTTELHEATAHLPDSFASILRHARGIARDISGEGMVASEHLLLALLECDSELQAACHAVGADHAHLREYVAGKSGPPIALDEPLELAEPTEQIDLFRILDANANRAREAARVVEDYCRFVLNDEFLSRELKSIRHALADSMNQCGPCESLHARDTTHDVGTSIETVSERRRESPSHVALVNLKRLQEALRALEEYSKPISAEACRALESLRYRSYTLEKTIVLGPSSRQRLASVRLCVLVACRLCKASLEYTIKEAAAGGAEMIQLREKGLSDAELLARAREVRRWTRHANVLFIVNDRPDIARLADADGVHLGQTDMGVHDTRRIVGGDALIGVSTHDIEQARHAILDGADYLGVGPTFASHTKNFDRLAGLDFVRQVAAETSLPAFAIGGIDAGNVGQVVAAGMLRVAVGHAIGQSDMPQVTARAVRHALG